MNLVNFSVFALLLHFYIMISELITSRIFFLHIYNVLRLDPKIKKFTASVLFLSLPADTARKNKVVRCEGGQIQE